MQRVRMKVHITGYRNGEPWPQRGGELDLPDNEAADLAANNYVEILGEATGDPADDGLDGLSVRKLRQLAVDARLELPKGTDKEQLVAALRAASRPEPEDLVGIDVPPDGTEAELAPDDGLERLGVRKLRQLATDARLELPKSTNKEQLVAALRAAQGGAPDGGPDSTPTGDAGGSAAAAGGSDGPATGPPAPAAGNSDPATG